MSELRPADSSLAGTALMEGDAGTPEAWTTHMPAPRHLAAMFLVAKIHGAAKVRSAIRHNARTADSGAARRLNIDVERTRLNEHLYGPLAPPAIEAYRIARMQDAGITQDSLRKNAVLAIEVIVSLPSDHGVAEREFFQAAVEWLG